MRKLTRVRITGVQGDRAVGALMPASRGER